jgi:hypothetical protein
MHALKEQSKRHIRFATVEKPTAWVVVAILVEKRGNETIILSQPKIVRIIPKNTADQALPEAVGQKLYLAGPIQAPTRTSFIVSPYTSVLFSQTNLNIKSGIAPQPPTF